MICTYEIRLQTEANFQTVDIRVCNLRVKYIAEEWKRRKRAQEDNEKARAEGRVGQKVPAGDLWHATTRAFSLLESLGSLTIAQRLNSFATSRRVSALRQRCLFLQRWLIFCPFRLFISFSLWKIALFGP